MVERMTALDAAFLSIERRTQPMHVGGLIILKPGPEGFDIQRMLRLVRERLHLVPRYRQKVRFVPGHLANPVWVDDPNFDLDYHLQHRALPAPGDKEQLWDLAGRLFSRSLDRSRPLWEGYLIDGLANDRVAILMKSHHCMVDGVSAVEMLTALVDPTPEPRRFAPEPWTPEPEPSDLELLASGVLDQIAQPTQLAIAMRDWVTDPAEAAKRAAMTAVGLGSAGAHTPVRLAKTPLNTRSTEWRRYRGVEHNLDEYKIVKNALGGTVNDVVLTVASGALRSWLLHRGEDVSPDLAIRIMAPASMRKPEELGSGGNIVSTMAIDAPVGEPDPLQRYRIIGEQTQRAKQRGEAVAAGALMPAADFIAPNLLAIAVRNGVSSLPFHTVVTNVPGPQQPLYMNGAEIETLLPFLPTFPDRALSHGILSYNGRLSWGLIGERDAMHDIDKYGEFLDTALGELVDLAQR